MSLSSSYPFSLSDNLLGLLEETVCVGDVYQVGQAQVEVSQPRQPCFKLARKWHTSDLAAQAEAAGRVGWYFRVRQEGQVESGQELTLLERPYPQWTIARVYALRRGSSDPSAMQALADCPALSPGWRESLRKRLSA